MLRHLIRASDRRCLVPTLIWFALLAAPPLNSDAAIDFYRVGKRLNYYQTSDSQPTTPSLIDGGVDMYATDPADLASARVFSTQPELLSPSSPFVLTQFAPGAWINGQYFSSVEEMDIAIPPGDVFGVLIEGGNLGSRLALARLPQSDLFAPDIPYFTGGAYSALNGLDTSQPFLFTWNSFVPALGVTDAPIFFSIYRTSDAQLMTSAGLPTAATSFTLPADTLTPNTSYWAQLYLSSRVNTVDAGFIDADSSIAFDSVTTLYFDTGSGAGAASNSIAEPAATTLLLAGILAIGLLPRSRSGRFAAVAIMLAVTSAALSPAYAEVTFYRTGKTVVYRQTSDAPPTLAPTSVFGGVDMQATSPSDIGSARVFSTGTMPPGTVPEFVLSQFSPGYWGYSRVYSTLAEMDSELLPGDTLGYLIEDGDLGDQLALLSLPSSNLFSTTVPTYTGNAFSQLNGIDPTSAFSVGWNSFVPAVEVNEAPIFFSINRLSDGHPMISSGLPTSATSFQVPAGTLATNTAYVAALDFSSRNIQFDAGFDGGDAAALFDVVTELHFTTGQTLTGDYNRDGAVNAADYVVWRKTLGQMDVPPYSGADGDGDGDILLADHGVWRQNFGALSGGGAHTSAVPEPNVVSAALVGMALFAIVGRVSPRCR